MYIQLFIFGAVRHYDSKAPFITVYFPDSPPLFLQLICRAGLPTISTRYDKRQRDKILKRLCHTQIPKTLYFLK